MKFGETVQRFPYLETVKNAHGREVVLRGDPVDVPNVGVDPGGEQKGSPAESLVEMSLFTAPGVAMHPLDQWRVRGLLYDVEVETLRLWVSPHTGWRAGQAIPLRRARG